MQPKFVTKNKSMALIRYYFEYICKSTCMNKINSARLFKIIIRIHFPYCIYTKIKIMRICIYICKIFLYKIEKKTNSIAVSSALRSSSHNLVAYCLKKITIFLRNTRDTFLPTVVISTLTRVSLKMKNKEINKETFVRVTRFFECKK